MIEFDKKVAINNYIKEKEKYCRNTDLLTDYEKNKLKEICTRRSLKDNDFFNLITDELSAFRKLYEVSYLYTYKQAQALIFCCNELKKKVQVDIVFDFSEVKFIDNQLYNIEMDHIKITYLGKEE